MKITNKNNELDRDAVRLSLSKNAPLKSKESVQAGAEQARLAVAGAVSDSVKISLGKTISSELDPAKLAQEREEKISKLKARIASGEYNPPASAIAESLVAELGFEISGNRIKFEDDE